MSGHGVAGPFARTRRTYDARRTAILAPSALAAPPKLPPSILTPDLPRRGDWRRAEAACATLSADEQEGITTRRGAGMTKQELLDEACYQASKYCPRCWIRPGWRCAGFKDR